MLGRSIENRGCQRNNDDDDDDDDDMLIMVITLAGKGRIDGRSWNNDLSF